MVLVSKSTYITRRSTKYNYVTKVEVWNPITGSTISESRGPTLSPHLFNVNINRHGDTSNCPTRPRS